MGRSTAVDAEWSITALGQAAVPVGGGKYAALVGGVEESGTLVPAEIRYFAEQNGRLSEQAETKLLSSRMHAAVGGDGTCLVVGGFTDLHSTQPWDLFPNNPTGQTEVLQLRGAYGQPQIAEGPTLDVPRGYACALTLRDGRILVAGGRGGPKVEAIADAELFRSFGLEGEKFTFSRLALEQARYFHTCTLLEDGSVLIAGGVQEAAGGLRTVTSVEIFVPRT